MRLIFTLFIALFVFSSCEDKHILVEQYINQDSTENWQIDLTYTQFYSKDINLQNMCNYLNQTISKQVNQSSQKLKDDADHFFTTYNDPQYGRPAFKYQLVVDDSLFLIDKHFVSIRLLQYKYEGGAHGMTTFTCYNLDLHNGALLGIEQILNLKKTAQIEALLADYLVNDSDCYTEKPKLTTNGFAGININKEYVFFTYEAYALGPYSCGAATIAVPIAELKKIEAIKHP